MPALQFLEDIHRLNEDGPTSRALPLLEAAALNYLNGWAVDPASLFIVPSQPHSRSNSRRLKKSCCRSLGPAAPTIFSWWPTIAWRLWRLPTARDRSEEHTSELQSLMRISYAVFCLKKKKNNTTTSNNYKK